jgi:two-component system NtrC family sensor kinase
MRFLQNISLSKKILLGIVPLFMLFVSISVILQNRIQERTMLEEAQAAALTYADLLKESMVSMMVNNLQVDSAFLKRVSELQEVDSILIFRNDLHIRPEVLTAEQQARISQSPRATLPNDDVERHVLATGKPEFDHLKDQFRAVIPFNATKVCQRCHAVPVDYALGGADIRVSYSRINQAAASTWTQSLVIFLVFSILVVAVASFMFTSLLGRPIDRLVLATKEVADGHLDYEIPGLPRLEGERSVPSDELRALALRFDQMRLALKEKIRQIDEVNRRLVERNAQLEDVVNRLRKAQEELIRNERLATTGWMSAQLSHELNNPIHNIQSLLESSLQRLPENGEARELVAVALEEVSRMGDLTRQMLAYFRGPVRAEEFGVVDLATVLDDAVSSVKEQLVRVGIDIEINAEEHVPPIRGDQARVRQMLLNLICNAKDAITPPGKITLKLEQFDDRARILVHDTGCGIPLEHLGKIFDPFFTTKKEVRGVGLGLFVSYGIVQQHQGTIAATSKVGEGTTLTVELPLMDARWNDRNFSRSMQNHG